MKQLSPFFVPKDSHWLSESLSGLTVALALVPEAIAFALVAGLTPFIGLYAAFFMCFITAAFGGRPGMISGATGSMAVVMFSIVQQFGINMLFATIVSTGVIQVIVGSLGLGKLIRMMPKPVMIGFVNGLAIVIFIAQFSLFKQIGPDGIATWLSCATLYWMIGLVLFAMFITHFLPKITSKIPGALAAIIIISLLSHILSGMGVDIRVVGDMMQGAKAMTFPSFTIPHVPLSILTLKTCLPFALILAMIGLSESLMTLSLIDEMTHTQGNGNKECLAQGAGNIISGLFGSMGGCAMIGQSMINVTSGGRGRLSGIVAAVVLLTCILFAWPLISQIPLAALAGVMFMVVLETFEWATFKFINKIPSHDALVIVIVTLVTVIFDLAIAVLVGVIVTSLVFAWQTAKQIKADVRQIEDGALLFDMHGLLFFASVTQFKAIFKKPLIASKQIVIDFEHAKVCDHSGIDAIEFVLQRLESLGFEVALMHLSPNCQSLLNKAQVKHFNVASA